MSVFEVVITGLIYVFAVLAMIVLLLAAFSLLSRRRVKVRKGGEQTRGVSPKKASELPEETGSGADEDPAAAADDGGIPPEVVAVITAAVAACEEENGRRKFKVLSFRRQGR